MTAGAIQSVAGPRPVPDPRSLATMREEAPEVFERFMRHRLNQAAEPDVIDPRDQARQAAQELIATTFITPVLGAMREHSFGQGPFAPTAAERRFGPMFDQHVADRVVKAANLPLVDAIVDRYLKSPDLGAGRAGAHPVLPEKGIPA